jgi:hypothetical protein
VEKVIYLLMDGDPDVGSTLRTDTVAALRTAGGKRIQVNVVDAILGPPFGVAPDSDAPELTAAVSAWVNTSEGTRFEMALPNGGPGGSWFGYLVTEAEPLPNTTASPGPDGRVPGFAQLVPLKVPEGLGWGEWRRRWQTNHTSVALGTQSTFRYVQNVVLRPLTPGAPRYAGIVEECFPLAAATDLHVFFDAVGDEAKLARHMAAMSESCDRFMDGVAPVAWTAEYLYEDEGLVRPSPQ